MTVQEQKKYLEENWKVFPLRTGDPETDALHKELIKDFKADKRSTLGNYLVNEAWEEDENGVTRIFLILNKERTQIVGYFGLSCGLLYLPEGYRVSLTDAEEKFVSGYLNAMYANGAYLERYENLGKRLFSEEEFKKLQQQGYKRYRISRDRSFENERKISELVDECYPSVELTHLCKNINYRKPAEIKIRFGQFAFWEIVVPQVLEIAKLAAAQYFYLFAAECNPDQNPTNSVIINQIEMKQRITPKIRKLKKIMNRPLNTKNHLIAAYIRDMKFRLLEETHVLKPDYDYGCFSMKQEICNLQKNREAFWNENDF